MCRVPFCPYFCARPVNAHPALTPGPCEFACSDKNRPRFTHRPLISVSCVNRTRPAFCAVPLSALDGLDMRHPAVIEVGWPSFHLSFLTSCDNWICRAFRLTRNLTPEPPLSLEQ
jgi:hypothetical protein